MSIKPDNIHLLSTLPNYINFGDASGTLSISGTIPNGSGQTFSTIITTSRNNTRFDIYATNQNTNVKQLISNTSYPLIYQSISSESVGLVTTYTSSSITVAITVNNFTGASITLVSQSWTINIVQYQIPY